MNPAPRSKGARAPVLKAAVARLRQLALATPAGDFLGAGEQFAFHAHHYERGSG